MINIRPYITEKSVKMAQSEQFTLIVPQDATKMQIKEAVMCFFKIKPVRVLTIKKTQLNRIKLRRKSLDRGFKKAIIVLKKGEKIPGFEIVSNENADKKKELKNTNKIVKTTSKDKNKIENVKNS
ncbi:MAG: 50S ribosomal protein L23 [Candidatus Berkelbacteria bacterium]|nr:50S ribosomal protein L23 [Candidatus Berkelbacteria bacterium]